MRMHDGNDVHSGSNTIIHNESFGIEVQPVTHLAASSGAKAITIMLSTAHAVLLLFTIIFFQSLCFVNTQQQISLTNTTMNWTEVLEAIAAGDTVTFEMGDRVCVIRPE